MNKKLANTIYWVLLAVALGGLALLLLTSISDFFTYQIAAIRYPYSIDYGEGPLLDQTLRMANFENIYRSTLAEPPYTVSNYPPLYILAQVPFAWIFGPAFWYGRLINLLSVVLTGLFITLTLKTLTRDWFGSSVAGLLLLAFPYIHHWAKFNRIDELALLLSWAALFVTVRFFGSAQSISASASSGTGWKSAARATAAAVIASRPFWAAVILFSAAIFTRQTYALAAPFAAFFWLIFGSAGAWKTRILRAVLLGLGVGGLSLILFLILNTLSAGGFYLNIVVANVNAFFWSSVKHYADEISTRLWPLLGLALAFLILDRVFSLLRRSRQAGAEAEPTNNSWALVLPYLLATMAGSITIGKDGSNVNYLLELSAALSLAGGAMLAWTWQLRRVGVRALVQLAVIALLAYQVGVMIDWDRKDNVSYIQDREAHLAGVAQTLQILKDAPGPVLADEYMGLVPLAGKRLYFQPFEFKQLAQAKVWNEQAFLGEIAAHKFDVILWYKGWSGSTEARWTPAQRQVVEMYYQLDRTVGDILVFRPKK